MRADDLDAVFSIEAASFTLPWTTSMFEEELSQGQSWREVAVDPRGDLHGRVHLTVLELEIDGIDPAIRRRDRQEHAADVLVGLGEAELEGAVFAGGHSLPGEGPRRGVPAPWVAA